MRIIAGKYKGRIIQPMKGLPVRPTTDRTKEALFNILNGRVDWESCQVLDLFAGTGNISMECWSRGVEAVISVDRDRKCVASMKKSFSQLGIEKAQIIQMDVWRYIKQCNQRFGLIFMDPPYQMPEFEEMVRFILEKPLLHDDGLLVVEHPKQLRLAHIEGFDFDRAYGSSQLSFFYLPEQHSQS